MLSIPTDRIGGYTDPSIVSGELGEGEFIEENEREGLVERGTLRPYQEVVGKYKDAYLKGSEKMGLPADLQRVLSDYFSSIE